MGAGLATTASIRLLFLWMKISSPPTSAATADTPGGQAPATIRSLRKACARIRRIYWKYLRSEWARVHNSLRCIDSFYERSIRDARKKGNEDEAKPLYGEWRAVREDEQYDVDRVETIHYRRIAARYRVPEPEDGPKYWRRHEYKGGIHLTVAGIDFIEQRVAEKRKHRWEFWLLLITAITGIIGSATGLIAILRR
jgi:hypothetical protein